MDNFFLINSKGRGALTRPDRRLPIHPTPTRPFTIVDNMDELVFVWWRFSLRLPTTRCLVDSSVASGGYRSEHDTGWRLPLDKAARSEPSYLCLVLRIVLREIKTRGLAGETRVKVELWMVWLYSINGLRGNYLMNLARQGKTAAERVLCTFWCENKARFNTPSISASSTYR